MKGLLLKSNLIGLLFSMNSVDGFTMNRKPLVTAQYPPIASTCSFLLLHQADKKSSRGTDDIRATQENKGILKSMSPGALLLSPFIVLFGMDLIANIAVLTKRSLEVFFTGEYTVWTPWE